MAAASIRAPEPLRSHAGTGALLHAQFVNVRRNREVLEVGEIAPACAPPEPPWFIGRFGRRRKIVRMNGLAVHFLGEGKQHLGHLAARCEPVGARTVIPLLETLQFELKPQHLDAEFLGALRLTVAFQSQRTHHRFQRVAILW